MRELVFVFFVIILLSTASHVQSFLIQTQFPAQAFTYQGVSTCIAKSMRLSACKRNTRDEKDLRNRMAAMKWASSRTKLGAARRMAVRNCKRAIVAGKCRDFVAQLFHYTTDEDDVPLTGFDDVLDYIPHVHSHTY